jgi:hypothetical protein
MIMKAYCVWLARGSCRGLPSSDKALAREAELPIRVHTVTPRGTRTHHGIYFGRGEVVQYGGPVRGLGRGPAEQVSLSRSAQGRCYRLIELFAGALFVRREMQTEFRDWVLWSLCLCDGR